MSPIFFIKSSGTGYALQHIDIIWALLVSTGRVGSSTHYVFLQSMLLLINADFALRSQFTLESKAFTRVEPCWAMAFGGMLCVFCLIRNLRTSSGRLLRADPIRARMAQMFLGAVALITPGL